MLHFLGPSTLTFSPLFTVSSGTLRWAQEHKNPQRTGKSRGDAYLARQFSSAAHLKLYMDILWTYVDAWM